MIHLSTGEQIVERSPAGIFRKENATKREEMMQQARAQREPLSMIVVGGGATGVGVALDAAARGYKTLLLEQHDFGKGTSSRSTKLVHGGVRYLEQGQVSLVMEALKERGNSSAERTASGERDTVRRTELLVVGRSFLRDRTQTLSRFGWEIWIRTIGTAVEGRNSKTSAEHQHRGTARRRYLL